MMNWDDPLGTGAAPSEAKAEPKVAAKEAVDIAATEKPATEAKKEAAVNVTPENTIQNANQCCRCS